MCGINGIYHFSSNKDRSENSIQKMNDSMVHRGPDAEGYFEDDYVSFGHRRLSIIDVKKHSNQPLIDNTDRYIIIFNGEIYNYKELKSLISNYDFKTNSDTEVILAAFIKWGKLCVNHFNGMFAFSIWDKVEKSMFIARDRMGIKPLYYYLDNEKIVYSSSAKSILNSGLVPRRIREESLIDYMQFQTVHAPYTLINEVYSLMPGQYMLLTEEKQEITAYWSPATHFKRADNNIDDVKSNVRKLLSESVDKRMMSDVPFGAFLSGGIDSSLLVALMSKTHNQKVDTFSVVFNENEFSEGKYAKEIADKYNTNHHEIDLSVNDFKDMIPEALSSYDLPSGDGLNTYVVSKKTTESGIKMALSGLGGDELFGGYSVFNQIPNLQNKKWLSSFPNYARKQIGNLNHLAKGTIASSKIKEILKQEYFDTEYIYQFYRQVLMDDQVKGIVNSNKLPLNRTFEITHDLIGYQTPGWNLPPLSRISVAEFSTYMQNVLLRDADQMSMANSLEVRVPFLDHNLVEYVLGINDKFKNPTTPKKLLVDSFQDLLPESIYNRPKMGFVLPYEKWMKEELAELSKSSLDHLKQLSIINDNGIDRLWTSFEKGNKRVGWSRILHLVVLGNWIKENKIEG
jgi:asparagine synthase (glutamine-hydrolysing)